jgi:adenylate kinase family enzyme
MAPDEEVLPVLWHNYYERARGYNVILDGYPRTLSQLDDFWARGGRIGRSILLDPGDLVATERLIERKLRSNRVDDDISIAHKRIKTARNVIEELTQDSRISQGLTVYTAETNPQQTLADVLCILAERNPTATIRAAEF